MSDTLRGTTLVTVGDRDYTLKPTLGAVRKIEAMHGGLVPAFQMLSKGSVDGVTSIIAAGADLKKQEQIEALAEDVFQAGVQSVALDLIPYISFLLKPSHKDDEPGEGNAQPAEAP